MSVRDLDFEAAISQLCGWIGQSVSVTVGRAGAPSYLAALCGTLNRAQGPPAVFEGLLPGEVLYFSVGTEGPDELSQFALDRAEFTAAQLGETHTDPARPQLGIRSGDIDVGVTLEGAR